MSATRCGFRAHVVAGKQLLVSEVYFGPDSIILDLGLKFEVQLLVTC